MSKFVHLHTHSHYSLLDGLAKIDQLIARAKECKMDALALTDHGVMYGAIEFYQKAIAANIKPIIGVEAYLAPEGHQNKQSRQKPYHLVLLAKNQQGYQNLLKLTTIAHLKGFYYKPRIDKELLKQYHQGLIASSACIQGEIAQTILKGNIKRATELAKEYQEIFGPENYYLEVQYHPNIPEQKIVNQGIFKISQLTNIPVIATNDAHYIYPADSEIQDILLCLQTKKQRDDPNRLRMNDDFSFRSSEEMATAFYQHPEVITNTQKIARQCNLKIELHKTKLPYFPLPKNKTADNCLAELAKQGLAKRYTKITPALKKRLVYELGIIKNTGFASYFLIVQDFVKWAKQKHIQVGPGRGSAPSSLVSYCLDVTNVDPLKYDLIFERFLNPERISMPDIDLDFADTRRDEVLQYVEDKYGKDHVAQIITFGTMAARAAIRDVGRVLSFPYNFCDRLAKMIPLGLNLEQSLSSNSELKSLYQVNDDARKIIDSAKKLEGVVRHSSRHACGILITPEPLTKYVPLQYETRGEEKAIISQYSMKPVEVLGLLKMDFLGLKNLSILETTIKIISKTKNKIIDLDKIPLDDKKTYSLFRSGKTVGVFQLECLSGDTIVSNTTIEKLFKYKDKKTLESVYVDEGQVHRNIIQDVLYKGKERVYTLVTENNRFIKTTANHYFLTKNSWKKLRNIKKGEKVLMKIKAKHMLYRTCENCGKQVNGDPKKPSRFCYKCSAGFYKNPSKPKSRKKISEGRIKFYRNGGKPWNFGLTVGNSEIWNKTAKKISKALSGRTLEDILGEERAKKFKRDHSKRMTGKNNPMFGRSPSHRKGGFRDDLGHYVRSSWEADFARILKLLKLNYQYEPKTFKLIKLNGEVMHYTPDFYVKSKNTFYEIKGWLHDLDKEKMKLFQEQYSQYNFVLISATKFAEFALKYKNLVKWECPRIPVKSSFQWVKVKKIIYGEKENVYDIVMKSPGNNFVANSFVVHNSDGMRKYLKQLRPTCLEDIIAMVSLYRPGPISLIPEYISNRQGNTRPNYLHPKLKPILEKTYGIAIYQEQLLEIVRKLAGFSYSEADVLRKAVGKKIISLLKKQRSKFIQGCLKNNISTSTAEEIFSFIEPFAGYGFNKSHSTCYALIAYQTAYLKSNYPTEFIAALLTADYHDTNRIAIEVEEAKRLGINILPPNVNESLEQFTVVNEKTIRFGLLAIKNIGNNLVQNIIKERKENGNYKSLEEFLDRLPNKDLNKKSLASLVKCGALDQFAPRKKLLFNLEQLVLFHHERQQEKKNGQGNLFNLINNSTEGLTLRLSESNQLLSKNIESIWEKELLGLYLSCHPFQDWAIKLKRTITPCQQLDQFEIGSYVKIGGVISKIKKIITYSKKIMYFIKIEDISGSIEILVFPGLAQRKPDIWQENKLILVKGKISNKDGVLKLLASQVEEIVDEQTS